MSNRAAAIWMPVFVVLAVAGGGASPRRRRRSGRRARSWLASTGQVVRVIDGDTVECASAARPGPSATSASTRPRRVKPGEPVQCFGKRASAFNRRLVSGRQVRLRFGRERRDRYGRLLAYVYLPGQQRGP